VKFGSCVGGCVHLSTFLTRKQAPVSSISNGTLGNDQSKLFVFGHVQAPMRRTSTLIEGSSFDGYI
jgi:hypothetical protein